MNTALIGHTGFVGRNLARQLDFDHLYNSKNINEIRGCSFDLIVCAGVSAKKWIAIQDPERDWENINKLLVPLRDCKAKSAILISTIDVYPVLSGVNEDFDCHGKYNHAYGVNRLRVEDYFMEKFEDCTIVRLPGLFGNGLQKNIIYDLLHDNMLEKINPQSEYQWYYLEWLWRDIELIRSRNISLAMLATTPVVTRDILKYFPDKVVGQDCGPLVRYDVHSKYGAVFGGAKNYIHGKDSVLMALAEYISAEKSASGC
jgi:hypothetical protein